jgi:hypothetical protein
MHTTRACPLLQHGVRNLLAAREVARDLKVALMRENTLFATRSRDR